MQSTQTPRFVSHLLGPPVDAQSASLEQLAVHWPETLSQTGAAGRQSAALTQSRQIPAAVSHNSAPRQSSSVLQPVQTRLSVSKCDFSPVQSSSLVHELWPLLPELPALPPVPGEPGLAESEPQATA